MNFTKAAIDRPSPPMTDARSNLAGAAMSGSMEGYAAALGQGAPQQPESELQYSARMAAESLSILEKCVHELANRLQIVLEQDTPTPAQPPEGRPQRPLSSQIANALMQHAAQTDNVMAVVRNLLRRLAL